MDLVDCLAKLGEKHGVKQYYGWEELVCGLYNG